MIENFKDLVRYRALLQALVVRHLAVRYRGSFLGFLWSFLNPLCLMLVYTLVFRYYIRFNQVDNYTIFLFCGLLPWIWSSSALIESTSSIVSSGHLITKSMFPAQILPAVSIITSMVNFLLSLPLLFVFMLIAGMPMHWTMFFVPVVLVCQFIFLLGIGLALSSLNVHFRDVQHIIGNLITFLFFLCPIVYPASVVPERFKFTMEFNPLALVTVLYHQLIIDGVFPSLTSIVLLLSFAGLSIVAGNMIFNRYRENFAELL